jgi:molecular chaperone DnaK
MTGYRLGVDLGTTFTAAAILRPGAAPEVVPLGTRSATVPSVMFMCPEGNVLVGDAAERRGMTDADRVVRQFKRRIGDPTPLVIGPAGDDEGCAAHDLAAALIAWVVTRVSEREGAWPDAIAVTHPATWGPHKKDLLRTALAECDLPDITFVSEPEAAARTYAHSGRIAPGATLAVYDLGGGTFDVALLHASEDGHFTPLGRPSGLPDLGGIDFDDAILAHVLAAVGPAATDLDPTDPDVCAALARLRRECVDAKEALSVDTTTTIPVLLGGVCTNVRLTRAELEAMIAPAVQATIDALDATLESAGLDATGLTQVVLTGGSSRVPVVAQLLSQHFGPSVTLERDIDPKTAVAVGGVLAIATPAPAVAAAPEPAPAPPVVISKAPAEPTAARAVAPAPLAPRPARPASVSTSLSVPDSPRVPAPRSRMRPRRALALLTLTTALMLGTGVALSAMIAPEDDPGTSTSGDSTGLDMAEPKKKESGDRKQSAKDGAAEATTSGSTRITTVLDRSDAPAEAVAEGEDAQRASATRKAAVRKTSSDRAAKSPAGSSRADKPGEPVEVKTVAVPNDFAVPDEQSEAAAPDQPSAADAAAEAGADSGGDTAAPADGASAPDPAANAPVEAPAAGSSATDEADSGGFGETAPPEAPAP